MIRAMIFDLDGTLVQTERLKAISYARAAVALCPRQLREAEVVEAFKDVVGRSRREVSTALIERFGLEEKARARMAEFGVSTPWQAYVQLRLGIYQQMISDPKIILSNQWPHNMALLQQARESNCKVGLATMSYCQTVQRVLKILGLTTAFDVVASRDDVEHGKPNPEIYQLVSHELQIPPENCLAIEDSPAGVEAGLAAGMHVVAVSTPFTRDRLHGSGLLPPQWIVDDPTQTRSVVAEVIASQAI